MRKNILLTIFTLLLIQPLWALDKNVAESTDPTGFEGALTAKQIPPLTNSGNAPMPMMNQGFASPQSGAPAATSTNVQPITPQP